MKTSHLAGALSPFWLAGLLACVSFNPGQSPFSTQPTAAQVCTKEKAVRLGIDHATRGRDPMRNVASVCVPAEQQELNAYYMAGYEEGIAYMAEQQRERTCGYNQAYKIGMNHGQGGRRMSLTEFDICDASLRAESERGYREGYSKGIEFRPPPAAPAAPVAPSAPASGPGLSASTASQSGSTCSNVLGSQCVMRVKIKNSCYRSSPLQYRFFNPDRNLIYPSNRQVFEARSVNGVSSHDIQCRVGERLCYGAQSGRSYWGSGIDGDQGCQNCCVVCGSGEPPIWNIGC